LCERRFFYSSIGSVSSLSPSVIGSCVGNSELEVLGFVVDADGC